ncbi:MAG: hypothetical protein K2Q18_03830 [Bdellovibrionales bacterium]|nr:hypothetical protein [Bdellovibrionales bacterium]
MKKLLLLSLIVSINASAQSLETHIYESVKPLGKILEGKKGKVVLGTFKSTKASDACTPSKAINTKISAALLKAGVKTTASHRVIDVGADQAEVSRVTKLSGGSYIILGTYELAGAKFKIDCSVFDHNGSGVGACEDIAAVTLAPEMVESINCPITPPAAPVKEEKIEKTEALPEVPETGDTRLKKIDDYICSVIHRDYDQ